MTNDFNPKSTRFKYQVVLKYFLPEDKAPIDISRSMNDFTIHSYYEECVFPVFQIILYLNRATHQRIQLNASRVKFLLEIRKFDAKITNEADVKKEYETSISNEVLIPFDIDRTPLPISTDAAAGNPNFPLQLDCFLERHLLMNKKLINCVAKDVSVKDLILYALNFGKAKNVIFTLPENEETYDQILIPPLNMTNTIEYLQEVYGIFKSGLLVFFDIKYSYILKRDALSPPTIESGAYQDFESIFFELYDLRTLGPDTEGNFEDKAKKCYRIKTSVGQIQLSLADTSSREIGGEDVSFSSRTIAERATKRIKSHHYSIENKGALAIPITNAKSSKEIHQWNNYANEFVEDAYGFELSSSQLQVQIPWRDLDPDLLTPNRRYNLIFHNDEYKDILTGPYRLTSTILKFEVRSDYFYRLQGGSIFKKIGREYFK
jgi:hypothetical protein